MSYGGAKIDSIYEYAEFLIMNLHDWNYGQPCLFMEIHK